jgi:hypothetical protein
MRPHSRLGFSLRRYLRLVLAGCATVAIFSGMTGAGVAMAGTRIPAIPDTHQTCTTGSSDGNTTTCMYVNGTGLLINYDRGSATVHTSTRTLDECISGPVTAADNCTGYENVGPGGYLPIGWDPNMDEPAGDYCATTYRLNSNGSSTQIGHTCVQVVS